jgi:hypothetical protein
MTCCYLAAAKLAGARLFLYPARLNFQPTAPFRDGLYLRHSMMAFI